MQISSKYMRVEASMARSEMGKPKDRAAQRRDYGDWVTPALMISSFIAGLILAAGHHLYYARLDNTLVGSATRQQWPIRFGTAFAFLAQTCLANATSIAYIQWVWRRCRQQAIQVGTIDAAFAADRNIFMFLKPGFVFKFPIAAGLAVIFWCIPISSLVTPATLGVVSKPHTTLQNVIVNQPSISNFDPETNRIYTPRSELSTKLKQMFTVLAGTGDMLRLSAPEGLQNVSYTMDLILPVVRCNASNETVRSLTASTAYEVALAQVKDYYVWDASTAVFHEQNLTFTIPGATLKEQNAFENNTTLRGQIGYYAMQSNGTEFPQGIWIAIADPPNGLSLLNATAPYSASYYTCTIRNASVTTNVAFMNNIQSLQASAIEEMELSHNYSDSVSGNESSALYAVENYDSFGSTLYTQLSGFVMDYQELNPQGNYKGYSWNWSTSVDATTFGTAADFSRMTASWKDQGLPPDVTVQSKNLTTLIEELSLNASWSLMSMPSFNNKVSTQVNQTLWVNKYTYDPKNLLIAYGCSTLACLITILAGAYAIYANGESHGTQFSSIGRAMQSPDIAALFAPHPTNASALDNKIAQTRIRLLRNRGMERFRTETEDLALNPI